MTNLCVTCSHFELNPDSPKNPELGLCKRVPPVMSLVTGFFISPPTNFANVERLSHMPCGVEGKLHTDPTLSVYTTEVPHV
jgi:hypothetical protein